MRRKYSLLVAAFLALILTGCNANADNSGVIDTPNAKPQITGSSASPWTEPTDTQSSEATPSPTIEPSKDQTPEPTPEKDNELKEIGQEVVEILRERDLKSLSEWIDPEHGLRFSPYSYINKDTDLVFSRDDLPTFSDTEKITWGAEDGSGDPIALTFRDYYDKFVYSNDFANAPNVSVNEIMGHGNAVFNGTEVYQNASYIEFHFPGFDKQYDGMDWQSLALLFVPRDEGWKLVAIVHGQWTI